MGLVLRRDDDVADVSVKAGSNDGIVEEGVVSMISPRCFIGRTYSIDDDVHGTVKADAPEERSAATATLVMPHFMVNLEYLSYLAHGLSKGMTNIP